MNILIACEDLRVGGAQAFVLSLGRELKEMHEQNVYIYSQYSNNIDDSLINRIYPEAIILSPKVFGDLMIRKLDSLMRKMKIDFSLRNKIVVKNMQKTIHRFGIDLVHSNMFKSDDLFARALKNISIPFVITMHGNYEEFFMNFQTGKGEVILNYYQKVNRILQRIQGLVYLSEKNKRIFDTGYFREQYNTLDIEIKKIYNGFRMIKTSNSFDGRKQLGIPENHTVFGMVARGIPEKGWESAIKAFQTVNSQKLTSLILVGSSPYLDQLKGKYCSDKDIYFVGHSDNPFFWIKSFDVGLLPTTFKSESLPTSIIEYLSCGLPVIATDIGEISNMLTYDGKIAGKIIKINGEVQLSDLSNAMNKLMRNKGKRINYVNIAKNASNRFSLKECATKYMEIYSNIDNR